MSYTVHVTELSRLIPKGTWSYQEARDAGMQTSAMQIDGGACGLEVASLGLSRLMGSLCSSHCPLKMQRKC